MEAAFFDLDKTVIAKASIMAFGRDFYRAGMISRRSLLQGLWTQLVYVRMGASAKKLARMRRSVLSLTIGWEQARVRQIVHDALIRVVDPITYAEAVEAMDEHRRAGRRVYIVSAAPAEIVEPLARYLGVEEAIASQADIDEYGRYTGHMRRYAYGPTKALLMRQTAERDGVDLSRSWAYTDSATDLPMLEAVGHPVAVNPDRVLRRTAQLRGWEIRRFERVVARTASGTDPADATDLPEVSDDIRRRRVANPGWVGIGASTVLVVATSGATAWWLRRRRAPAGLPVAQLARSFLPTRTDRPTSVARMMSFFMARHRI
ncbi:MAG: HAD family hydrolase [Acidimicrobiales bacterium]